MILLDEIRRNFWKLAGLRFLPTRLADAYVIEPEPIEDRRGFFAYAFCAELS